MSQRGCRRGTFMAHLVVLVAMGFPVPAPTAADHTLTVESSPLSGASIAGAYPGVTPYTVSVPEDTPIELTAAATAGELEFLLWRTETGDMLSDGRSYTFSIAGPSSPLYAGTAKVDISPEQAVISGGGTSFRLPDELPPEPVPPDNIHDPLYARVVLLKNDDVSLAIVSVDVAMFSSKKVIDDAKAQWGVDHVILSATHTHSGMVPRGMCPTGIDWGWADVEDDPGNILDWPGFSEDPWYAETEDKIVAAIGEAMANLFLARIASGQSSFECNYMAHNRRHVNPDGSVTMWWDNVSRLPTEPLDPTVRVIRVDDESGNPRALMVHYACHPVVMMGDAMVTADFPGAMVDYIEQELGEDCMGMFLQGAEGDLDPYEISLRDDYGFNYMQAAGAALGEAALDIAENILLPDAAQASIQIQESMVNIGYEIGTGSTEALVVTVVIDDELALVAMPGEIFIQHQLDLAAQSPVANTLLLGIAYGGRGSPFLVYVPTAQALTEGGYGAGQCSFVDGDAGADMVSEGLACITSAITRNTTIVVEYAEAGNEFYVNDAYNATEDVYCTAAGNAANSGTSPDSPLDSLQAVLDDFDLEAGDTVYVDTGTYSIGSPVTIGADDAGVTVIGSTHSSGTTLTGTSALEALAVIQVNGADEVELRNLTVMGAWAGIHGSNASGLELANITAPGNGWAGILLAECDAPAVRRVTLDGNGFAGIHVQECDSGVVIQNALVCGTPCGIFADGSPSTSVSNATLYRNGWGVWFGNGATNGQVTNSIVATVRKRSYYGIYVEDPSQSGFQSDYNDHYVTGNANVGYWGGGRTGLTGWQNASSGDGNSLSTDPLLVDPENVECASRDYSLDESSPCIDAADSSGAPTVDIEGLARGASPDIGAHEYPSPAQPPTVDAVSYTHLRAHET